MCAKVRRDEILDLIRRHRPAQQIPLNFRAPTITQQRQLLCRFHTLPDGRQTKVATHVQDGLQDDSNAGINGLPDSLVLPWHKAFQPRVGLAWRVPKIKQTVVRAGFGTNYTVGEYAGFATNMAHQPPFTDEQTNQEAVGNTASSACAKGAHADRIWRIPTATNPEAHC